MYDRGSVHLGSHTRSSLAWSSARRAGRATGAPQGRDRVPRAV